MKKTGFTLIELIAVIVILSLLSLIVIPIVENSINSGKDELYIAQIDSIKASLKKYAVENINAQIKSEGDIVYLTLYQLKIANYVNLDLTDPRTKALIPNDMLLKIEKKAKSYTYEVLETTGTSTTNEKYDTSIPVINSNPIVYYCNVINESDEIPNSFNDIINGVAGSKSYYDETFSNKSNNAKTYLTKSSSFRVLVSNNGAVAVINILRSGCE